MGFPVPNFPIEAIEAAKRHAVASFPNESCGLIVAGAYVPCENIAANPEKDFHIDAQHVVDADTKLEAVLHSHPQPFSPAPTAADMQSQIDHGCIFGIIPCNEIEAYGPIFWGDFMLEEEFDVGGRPRLPSATGKPHEALIGRQFIHGASDCYTLIRAWFWQNRQIVLPEFPRDYEWWKKNTDLYKQGFAKAGFRKISMEEAEPGDVVLGQVRSKIPNHGGILLAGSQLIHHLEGRLTCRSPIGLYMKHITHWLRFEGLPNV